MINLFDYECVAIKIKDIWHKVLCVGEMLDNFIVFDTELNRKFIIPKDFLNEGLILNKEIMFNVEYIIK